MAILNFATVFSSAGFAGESFDIAAGYNLSYATVAGDVVFAATGKTLTLTAGTWPTWIREVGKVFTTSSGTNPGPFTVVSVDGTFKILTVLETVVNETPVGVTNFLGSADTGIIDNLLSAGNGILTVDAPLVLYSTGTLGAARTLDISALEVESAQQGSQSLNGRWFFFSVQNSDISGSNTITVSATTSINGAGTLVIKRAGDYIFYHETSGIWRANLLNRPAEQHATIAMVAFTAADWSAGATKNQIEIIATGSPVAGQVGPHSLKVYPHYVVQICDEDVTPNELVDVEVQFDNSGNIFLVKAQKAKPFKGTALIIGSLE